MHMILKPGKLNGASSDRNKAAWMAEEIVILNLDTLICSKFFFFGFSIFDIPVRGLKINGETMLAKELMPEMHP